MSPLLPLVLLVSLSPGATAPQVYETFVALSAKSLWPGFAPAATPVAIYDDEVTWLFGHPDPPEGFEPSDRCPTCRIHPGQHLEVRANSSATLGNVRTATYLLPPRDRRTAEEHAAVVVHETFHVFQERDHPQWSADEAALMTWPIDDVAHLAWRRYETEALRRALDTNDAAVAAGWVGAAVELRRTRFSRLEEEHWRYERGLELREGLAQYVERRALDRLDATTLPAEGFEADALRRRCYDTGQAWAVLLDRLSPGWHVTLNTSGDDTWLDTLAARAAERQGVRSSLLPLEQREAIRRRAEADVATLSTKRLELYQSFMARSGWTLKIVLAPDAEPLWPMGFDPMNLVVIDDSSVMHKRWFKVGNARGRIEVLNRRGITVSAGDHPMFNGVREVIVAGLPQEPEVFGDGGELWVGADGVSAHFEKAIAQVGDRTCVVTVEP